MISISESSVDIVASALMKGDFNFFLQQLSTDNNYERNALLKNKVEAYKDALSTLLARGDAAGDCSISREELRFMFECVVGRMPMSPKKFISLLEHHRVHLTVVWKDVAQFAAYGQEHFPFAAAPGAKPLKLVQMTKAPKKALA